MAAVFAIHPQHVESVAWISERRDVLSGLLFVLTLAAYLGYVRNGRSIGRYCLVALPLALGMMAKPTLVTVPALLLLLDFWPLARLGRAADKPNWTGGIERPGLATIVLEKLPLFALSLADCLITMRTHDHPIHPLAWSVRIGNAAVSCVTYIVQAFYPADLAAYYPLPAGGWPTWQVGAAVATVGLVSAAAVIWRRRCPWFFVGWFWYLGMLVPVLGLVQVAAHAMADRYTYLPGIGLSIAVTWGCVRLCGGSVAGRRLLAAGAVAVVAVLSACAFWQASLWRDGETLWAHALACTTDNGEAERFLADILAAKNRNDEAAELYLRAQKHPRDSAPWLNLGVLRLREGKLDDAIAQFRLALAKDPISYLAEMNLGAALNVAGQMDEAMQHLRHAVELEPSYSMAHVKLAHGLLAQQQFDQAQAELEQAVALDPYNPDARNDLGSTLFRSGKLDQAIPQFEAALALTPGSAVAEVNLGLALAAAGRTPEAVPHYLRALQLDPSSAAARRGLEKAGGKNQDIRP